VGVPLIVTLAPVVLLSVNPAGKEPKMIAQL
jgi:hypothetical protein